MSAALKAFLSAAQAAAMKKKPTPVITEPDIDDAQAWRAAPNMHSESPQTAPNMMIIPTFLRMFVFSIFCSCDRLSL
jgi:hypothetical protein